MTKTIWQLEEEVNATLTNSKIMVWDSGGEFHIGTYGVKITTPIEKIYTGSYKAICNILKGMLLRSKLT